jgi:transposase
MSIMPAGKKYDAESQERAVRMYTDRVAEGDIAQSKALEEVGQLLGINPSTLKNWVRRDRRQSMTSQAGSESVDAEVVRLRRENAQLRRANDILKTASAFFAAAELDRKLGQ